MECLANPINAADVEIIRSLGADGIIKQKAEEELFKRYQYFIRLRESRYSLHKEDLLDAYSDAVLAAIHAISLGRFENRASLKTYIFGIYHHKCVDLIRKKTTQKNVVNKPEILSEMQLGLSDKAVSVLEKITVKSDLDLIKKKMNNLCGNCKQLLLLSADGYSDKQLAQQFNLKTADVAKTCRIRCLKKLRAMVS